MPGGYAQTLRVQWCAGEFSGATPAVLRRVFPCTTVREKFLDAGFHRRPWPCVALAREGNDGVLPASVIVKRCKSHAAKGRRRRSLILNTRDHLVLLQAQEMDAEHIRGKHLFQGLPIRPTNPE